MKRFIWTIALLIVASPTLADEGMWTLDNFPKDAAAACWTSTALK